MKRTEYVKPLLRTVELMRYAVMLAGSGRVNRVQADEEDVTDIEWGGGADESIFDR